MRPPIFVRPFTAAEQHGLEAGLRSPDAFTLRRCQILLASAKGYPSLQIADMLGCTAVTVRNAIWAFDAEGLDCLQQQSSRPKTLHAGVDSSRWDELRELMHQNPRVFGKPRSTWTLHYIAEVCFERGITKRRLSIETIRLTLKRMKFSLRRAKLWWTSPDPDYEAKKARRDRLIQLSQRYPDWVLGFEDEVWWSRLAQPSLDTWTDGPPMKVQLLTADDNDPDPDAISCYGMLRNDTHKVMVRFVEDRPLGDITIQFLDWVCWSVAKEGKKVLIVIWDDASWHRAEAVSSWVKEHNQQAKRNRRVKIVICELPVSSPWLNNIEPCWKHAKKAVMDPDRKLTGREITGRVCEHFGCELLPYLKTQASSECDDDLSLFSAP
jgi:transposase